MTSAKQLTCSLFRDIGVHSRSEILGRRIRELEDELLTYQRIEIDTAVPMLDL